MTKTVTLPIEEYEKLVNAEEYEKLLNAEELLKEANEEKEEAYRVQRDARDNYTNTWFLKVVTGFAIGFFVSKFFF